MKILTTLLAVLVVFVSQLGVAGNKKTTKVTFTEAPKPAFTLELPPMWSAEVWHGKTVLKPPSNYPHIQVWCITGEKDLNSAIKNIAKIVKAEVIQFKPVETKDMVIGGNAGKLIIGTGLEADDQDPSKADFFLFTANGKLFVLSVHGEGNEAKKIRSTMIKILTTFKLVN
jgi:hypothetical protein